MKEALKGECNKEFTPKIQWDTYANLLYKVGRVDEAVKWETRALDDVKALNNTFFEKWIKDYGATIEKMKLRQPTYLDQGAIWTAQSIKNITK